MPVTSLRSSGSYSQFRVPLFPISTGRNWGYGASSPAIDGAVILDLSALQAIKFVDRELGVVELEPGVTQGMLHQSLSDEGNAWLTPVHGGGPDRSLLGNALEPGYGLTPTTDHFEALTSLEAVLADGAIYRSAFHALAGAADRCMPSVGHRPLDRRAIQPGECRHRHEGHVCATSTCGAYGGVLPATAK